MDAGTRRRAHAPVVVTGAAGFLGSHLVGRLRAEGHPVVGLDAFRGMTTPGLAAVRLADLDGDPGFELIELDVTGPDLPRTLGRIAPAAVFHLAARPGARDTDTTALLRDNVRATAAVLAAASAAGVRDVLFTSSSSVYGPAPGPSRENDAVAPLAPYAAAKRAAELLCLAAALRCTVVRLFTVYGPGQRPDMAYARFIAAALTQGRAPLYQPLSAARDVTYVDDAVRGVLLAWRYARAPIYNIAGGEVVDLSTACRVVEELTGAAVVMYAETAPAQPATTRADLSLATRDLGYRPRVGLRAGLAAQVAAARAAAGQVVPVSTADAPC